MTSAANSDPFWDTSTESLELQMRDRFAVIALHFLRTASESEMEGIAGQEFNNLSSNTRASVKAVLAARLEKRSHVVRNDRNAPRFSFAEVVGRPVGESGMPAAQQKRAASLVFDLQLHFPGDSADELLQRIRTAMDDFNVDKPGPDAERLIQTLKDGGRLSDIAEWSSSSSVALRGQLHDAFAVIGDLRQRVDAEDRRGLSAARQAWITEQLAAQWTNVES